MASLLVAQASPVPCSYRAISHIHVTCLTSEGRSEICPLVFVQPPIHPKYESLPRIVNWTPRSVSLSLMSKLGGTCLVAVTCLATTPGPESQHTTREVERRIRRVSIAF